MAGWLASPPPLGARSWLRRRPRRGWRKLSAMAHVDLQEELPAARRKQRRDQLVAQIPRWYRPWLHLAVPSSFGVGIMVGCMAVLDRPDPWAWMTIPATWMLANVGEWQAHKHLLHRRSRFAPILYDRHTPEHHVIYVTRDMAMRSTREFRLVLIPAYGIMLVFLSAMLPALALWLAGLPNVAALFIATIMAYVLHYEWLHLAYHLRADHPISRMRIIGWLRNHHAVHHDPSIMQRWNFNVTLPLSDWIMRTSVRDAAEARRRQESAQGPRDENVHPL